MTSALLEIRGLETSFGGRRRFLGPRTPLIRAVDSVDLDLREGEILGLVGESGCGKSTLAKTVLGLERETAGSITLDGRDVSGLARGAARQARRDIQYVHQDPGAALDPWWSIGNTLHETLQIHGLHDRAERESRIDAILEAVGLDSAFQRRYPHELSGGQQRRVGLARTLVLKPRIVILDEPTSGLDLSLQATVLRLIRDLRSTFGLTYLMISHDLSVVERMCDRVAIMYLGRIVELAETDQVFRSAKHPYTHALLAAAPRLQPGQIETVQPIEGDPPSAEAIPSGCAFRTRCPHATPSCADVRPTLSPAAGNHSVACFNWQDITDGVDLERLKDEEFSVGQPRVL